MGTWISVETDIFDNPKTRNLKRILGLPTLRDAAGYAIALFIYVQRVAWRTGDLSEFEVDGIEDACYWQGESGKLVEALQNCGKRNGGKQGAGFLDGLKVHDWTDRHNRLIRDRIYQEDRRKYLNTARHGQQKPAEDWRPKTEDLARKTKELLARRAAQS